MTPNGLPGICRGCGNAVVYTSRHWRNPATLGRHVCPPDRPTCGVWMRNARELCGRAPGHRTEHRSRWAMDNQLQMVTGRRKAHTAGVEASGTPTT